MTLEEMTERLDTIEKHVAQLSTQRLAMRDVTARLLAHLALRSENPEAVLKEFSEAGDYRVDQSPPENDVMMAMGEAIRKEKDWVVSAARDILAQ